MTFCLRVGGRDHASNEANCPGCDSIETEQYPRPHKDFGTSCLGLIHAERLLNSNNEQIVVLVCDTCFANPR
jgi:hypothetical protein